MRHTSRARKYRVAQPSRKMHSVHSPFACSPGCLSFTFRSATPVVSRAALPHYVSSVQPDRRRETPALCYLRAEELPIVRRASLTLALEHPKWLDP